MAKIKKIEALDYHSQGRPGKIEVLPTKPYSSQRDLSLAYSPGVADPCLEISKNVEDVYKYTSKGNLVAVISNGTAVLGLGDIGPEASKPVMEGKGLLFKIYADLDVFDIEVDATDVDHFVSTVKAIAPTFGGINLEDIKSPECFEIERRLKEELNIPIMHDDQHGTAIISGAALLNALEIAEKNIEDIKVVVNGAGASAISCAKIYVSLGVKKENLVMLDSKGVIRADREELSKQKAYFASNRDIHTLEEAMNGADAFLGLSKGGMVSQAMVKSMAAKPIVFALANPTPEITYQEAIAVREDLIMATGRSDNPNQVNNVLGFPFIFRGAMDVRATGINEAMKIAAVKAIAGLAKETVPDEVSQAYGNKNLVFGSDYIIPKPMDSRLLTVVSPAVAKAAMDSGIAQKPIENWTKYEEDLENRMGLRNKLVTRLSTRAKRDPKRVVFAEADNYKILKAVEVVRDEGIAIPILLGIKEKIEGIIKDHMLDLEGVEIIDPRSVEMEGKRKEFGKVLYEKRKRRGYTLYEAEAIMRERNYFGAMMCHLGEADAFISGLTRNYADAIKPSLQIIGKEDGVEKVAGMYMTITKNGPVFFADTTVNLEPTAQDLCDITALTAKAVKNYSVIPRIALLSYSNFGSSEGEEAQKMRKAVGLIHEQHPDLIVDGELQANFAVNSELLKEKFSFSKLGNRAANTLIFPNLSSGNIAYKLVQELGEVESVGPILLGMKKSVHILQLGSSVREIVNMVTIAVVDAQVKERENV